MEQTSKLPSLSIIMPAYKEADSLPPSYESVLRALKANNINDYEVLIMPVTAPADGSDDGTVDEAKKIAAHDTNVKVYVTERSPGLGFIYRRGLSFATKDYVGWVPSHNLTEESSLVEIFKNIGKADSVLTYTPNMNTRPLKARIVSKCYVILCNILFGLHVKYYNGISIHRRDYLQSLPLTANNHSIFAQTLVYMIKGGARYIEVPQVLKKTERAGREFNMKSVWGALKVLFFLFWEVRISRNMVKFSSIST